MFQLQSMPAAPCSQLEGKKTTKLGAAVFSDLRPGNIKTCALIRLRLELAVLPLNNNRMSRLPIFHVGTIGMALLVGVHSVPGKDAAATDGFKNPVVAQGQDPWVVRWRTNYYLCQSRSGSIWVNRSARLAEIGADHWKCVWRAPEGTGWSRQIWAPELHFLQGRWFIYVAADDGHNANHRMYVLEGHTNDPQASFAFKGKIASPSDRWAIDGTTLEMPDGKLYFVWSGWADKNDGPQNLYIASMKNPWTIDSRRTCISRPDQDWEMRDPPGINEGPETLWHDGHLFIIYSANGFWNDNYCLGQLTWTGGDVLDAKSWVKKTEPAFTARLMYLGPAIVPL